MSTEIVCTALVAAWAVAFFGISRYMANKEVSNSFQLQVSKANHPAGKALNRQIRAN
jgi:hypothetical protein